MNLGLVRSPVSTTVMQVSSRLLLVWAVVDRYPQDTAPSVFYSTMLLAWSVTEVIRYSYFVFNLQSGGVPGFLTWLRYNTFYVLYPVGIASECALIWKASMTAESPVTLLFWAILGIYVPGERCGDIVSVRWEPLLTTLYRELCSFFAHDGPKKEGHKG